MPGDAVQNGTTALNGGINKVNIFIEKGFITMKKKISMLLIAAMLASVLAGCGSDTQDGKETSGDSSGSGSDGESTAAQEYNLPKYDFGGADFNILNVEDDYWTCYNNIDVDGINGDVLNDAVFNRNAKVAKQFNLNFKITKGDIYKLNEMVQTAVASGEQIYDIVYVKPDAASKLLTENTLINLHNVSTLQLDQDWWYQYFVENLTIEGKLYFAASSTQLMPISLASTILFNKKIVTDNQLDLPYDLVRDGKWTYDEMYSYVKKGISTGTQSDYKWNPQGDAVYGIFTHNGLYLNMVQGSGEDVIVKNAQGIPEYKAPGDRFYKVMDILAQMMKTGEGNCASGHDGVDWINGFAEDRAIFISGELKEINNMREMRSDFGVLPIPKLDAAQESYYSMVSQQSIQMAIPKTVKDPEAVGAVMDYMAYISMDSVWDAYVENLITAKLLRDDDSVEMVNIIKDTLCVNLGTVYGWSGQLWEGIKKKLKEGNPSVSSDIASFEAKIPLEIQKSLDAWE